MELKKELINKDSENIGHYLNAGIIAFFLKQNYKEYFTEYIDQRMKKSENSENDFWINLAKELIEFDTKKEEEKSEYLHFVLDQFNQAGFNEYAILTANILDQYDPSNFSLIVHTSIFDKMLFLEKTIEYLDKIRKRNENGNTVMPPEDLWYNYGRIYYENKKYAEAQPFLLNYYGKTNKKAVVNYLLGMCYLHLGDKEKAKEIFLLNKSLNDKSQMEYINRSIRQLNKM